MPNASYMFGGSPRLKLPNALCSVSALLLHLGLSQPELKKIRWFRSRMYTTFEIKKISGKLRIIDAPDRRLKMHQRKVADLLMTIYRPRNSVHGFVVDRSVKSNAHSHLKHQFIVNVDISEFFPSISSKRIAGLLWRWEFPMTSVIY